MFKKLIIYIIVLVLVLAGYSYLKSSLTQNNVQQEVVSQSESQQSEVIGEVGDENTYADISPEGATNLIKELPGVVILDVSSAYDKGHLPGAINYYVGDGSLEEAIPTLDKEATYLVYCHVEAASRQGAQMLIDAGIKSVYRLAGEYGAWVDAGYDIEK